MEKLNDKLNSMLVGNKKIFILKGFNSILNKLNLNVEKLIDLDLSNNILELDKINKSTFMSDIFSKLATNKNFYCLYEDILYIEQNNILGLITGQDYKLKIIDIGCFNYYYPGFIFPNIVDCIKEFDKGDTVSNIYLQKFYTHLTKYEENTIIAYNIIENQDLLEYDNLIDHYSNDYIKYQHLDKKTCELVDSASNEFYIKIFNDVCFNKYNTIVYKKQEDKDDVTFKKFLYLLNLLGANIIETKAETQYKKPELYNEYLSILKRINPSYEFKEISVYKDPFNSNEKINISQSVIIDNIYQNILKAKNGQYPMDTFVTAPTGAGKSVLFQIPAVMAAEKENLVTIVISPLIGLMKDQVNNIKKITKTAATINSEYTPFEKENIKEKIRNGETSIIYISPETLLGNNDITTFIGDRKIGLLVVDEAHTVATWGKNFRPDYWYLGDYLDGLRHKMGYIFPIATFTATATISNGNDDMYHDIIESLNMTCDAFFGNVKRDDISFNINICKVDHAYQEEKEEVALSSINNYIESGEKTLIYFPYVKTLNDIYSKIPQKKVGKYYGNLDKLEKDETLEDIRFGNKKVVLATKAFGMGIDVKDIKNVYHFAPTGNLADYVQEIGRAARAEGIHGIASTDYFEKDFRYINKLYGMSQIRNYDIISVLKKIDYKYKNCNKRNFLVSIEEFAHIFNATNDDEIENKLKATIIAIKKDFKAMSNYVPLIFKPRGMFTKGLFYIPDCKLPIVKSYGWGKYISKKYDREELNKKSTTFSKIYIGDVYEFDFKRCWEDNYNGKYDGITFGQFKRNFYNGDLPGIDRNCFLDRMILTLETKYNNNFEWVMNRMFYILDKLKLTFDELKISKKWYTTDKIAEILYYKDKNLNLTKLKNIMDPLINLLISYETNTHFGKSKFCEYNSQNDKYHIDSPYYDRVIKQIKDAIKIYLENHELEQKRVTLVDTSQNKNQQMRNDPLLIAVQLMELLDVAVYTLEAGNKPEFFIRVNSEKTIKKVIDDKYYKSKTLASIQQLHYNSVRYMKYFFEKLNTDEDRWQFIEDYFLGKVEDKYNIGYDDLKLGVKAIDEKKEEYKTIIENSNMKTNTIKVYTIFHNEDDITAKYYISSIEVNELKEKDYYKLSPDCAVAKKLNNSKSGDVFDVNGYEYMVEKIENYDTNN